MRRSIFIVQSAGNTVLDGPALPHQPTGPPCRHDSHGHKLRQTWATAGPLLRGTSGFTQLGENLFDGVTQRLACGPRFGPTLA